MQFREALAAPDMPSMPDQIITYGAHLRGVFVKAPEAPGILRWQKGCLTPSTVDLCMAWHDIIIL